LAFKIQGFIEVIGHWTSSCLVARGAISVGYCYQCWRLQFYCCLLNNWESSYYSEASIRKVGLNLSYSC